MIDFDHNAQGFVLLLSEFSVTKSTDAVAKPRDPLEHSAAAGALGLGVHVGHQGQSTPSAESRSPVPSGVRGGENHPKLNDFRRLKHQF
jgi:hypothetical protein